jgi:glycine/D-amino acid oxidase-like deaminating enzyme
MDHFDFIVVGGGVIGSAVAYGIAGKGHSVAVLDGGGEAYRASLGNFGLVWVQGKGQGSPDYAEWCHETSVLFPAYARTLLEETGVDVIYRKPGGLTLCHDEAEYDRRTKILQRLAQESRSGTYDCEMIDRQQIQEMLPGLTLGPRICGASYSPHDGYLNPLLLLNALHIGITRSGGRFFPDTTVVELRYENDRFTVTSSRGSYTASKIILAAGNGITRLGAMLDMHIPVAPQQGQLLVTERVKPCLPMPISGIQQTHEGTFLVGLSNRNVGYDTSTDESVMKQMAQRVVNAFPELSRLKLVRAWSSLRVLSPDGLPIYQQSEAWPGAYAVTSHSGVSLAPMHHRYIVDWILEGREPDCFRAFSARRFEVEETAH